MAVVLDETSLGAKIQSGSKKEVAVLPTGGAWLSAHRRISTMETGEAEYAGAGGIVSSKNSRRRSGRSGRFPRCPGLYVRSPNSRDSTTFPLDNIWSYFVG